VWDLATGTPIGDPFTGHNDTVRAVAAGQLDRRPVAISGSDEATTTAKIERMHGEISGDIRRDTIAELEVKSSLHALTLTSGQS
jgi:hypothetical protein